MEEFLIEEGIVISKEKGFAEVAIFPAERCEECSAKIFCKPDKNDRNIVRVDNSLGAEIGDNVRIEIKGKSVLSASFTLYGLPLIILIIGLFLGLSIFSSYQLSELYASLFALALTALYFILTFFNNKQEKNLTLPKIILIRRNK